MTPDQAARAAAVLLDARRNRQPVSDLPDDLRPLNTADAEAICEAMARGLEQPIGGWKIGALDRRVQTARGLERPFCGQIPARHIHRSGVTVAWPGLMRPVVEAELAFRLGRDLPERKRAYSRDEIIDAIAAVVPGIEIPDMRLSQNHRLGNLGMVLDQGLAGRFVAGNEMTDWHTLELGAVIGRLFVNDRPVADGHVADLIGDPLDGVLWLANHRPWRGGGLWAGQIISTGTLTGVQQTRPGDRVVADFRSLGQVMLEIGR